MLQSDLLQCYQVISQLTAAFKDCGIGSLNAMHNSGETAIVSSIKVGRMSYQAGYQDFTSPSLSSLMYVSNLPKPISDWAKHMKIRRKCKHRHCYSNYVNFIISFLHAFAFKMWGSILALPLSGSSKSPCARLLIVPMWFMNKQP